MKAAGDVFTAHFHRNNSIRNTTAQDDAATANRLPENQATAIPTTSAAIPEIGDCVAKTIAGNVITVRVIYGT